MVSGFNHIVLEPSDRDYGLDGNIVLIELSEKTSHELTAASINRKPIICEFSLSLDVLGTLEIVTVLGYAVSSDGVQIVASIGGSRITISSRPDNIWDLVLEIG